MAPVLGSISGRTRTKVESLHSAGSTIPVRAPSCGRRGAMHVVVATHGHCFDGLASAVVFTRLMQQIEGGKAEFSYRACGYGDGQLTPTDAVLSGDQNAILDYRFAASERLT